MLRHATVAGLLTLVALPLAAQSRPGAGAQDPWATLSRPRTHTPRPTAGAITPADLETRLYQFADDSMQGRLLGTPGNVKGAEYIASEVRRLGLEPAGENGTYFQTLPLVTRAVDTTATITAGGRSFRAWGDFIPRDQGPGTRSISGAPVVYGGDFADTIGRLSPAAAAGKVVVITFSGSIPGNPPGVPNRGVVNQFYASAAGIVIVARDGMPEDQVLGFKAPSQAILFDDPPAQPAYLYVTKAMAEAMMGVPLASLRAGATSTPVQGDARLTNTPSPDPARNVVAILRGSDPTLRAEYVAVGGHNDHIGMGRPVAHDSQYVVNHLFRLQGADDPSVDSLTPAQAAQVNAILARIRRQTHGASARVDSIYNGADDDGSGSMAVLEIAERLATARVKPKRSVIFVWHVGEEAGLLGSAWFTDHPTVPRDSIVAQLNIDMIGRGDATDVTGITKDRSLIHGNPDYVQLVGSRRISTQLGDMAEELNRHEAHPLKFDYSLDANGHPSNIYCRSDHYEYARYGIPIIFFTTGGHADYHQVSDEPQYIDYPHYARVANFIADLAVKVADAPTRPMIDHPLPDPHGRCQQ
ncbi:MAG TPA: M28 family peptidase [Gemmatimonadales bacterium]|nr:M28 family peptidase [Gemmatimonadales bacterium]